MRSLINSRWAIMLGAMVGLIVGTGPMMAVTFSLFVKPVTEDLGWSRATFSSGPLFIGVAMIFIMPAFGWLLDNYGVKRSVLPLIVLMTVALVGFSTMQGSIVVFYMIYAVFGVAACGQSAPMYAKVVSMWFDRQRGIALGVATSGAAIGNVLLPLEGQYLIDHYGWRAGYLGLGITNLLVAFTVVALLLREPAGHKLKTQSTRDDQQDAPLPGLTLKEALRTRTFWMLAGVVLLTAFGLNGALKHSVALLTDRNWSPAMAVRLYSMSGFASILGRLIGGWVLDKARGPLAPATLLLLPAVSCILLASGSDGFAPVVAVLLLGFSFGVEVDIVAYFFGRYFGMRAFGQIYGLAFSGFAIGSGLGPWVMGLSYDRAHSYAPALILNAVLIVCGFVFVGTLGRYVYVAHAPSAQPRSAAEPAKS